MLASSTPPCTGQQIYSGAHTALICALFLMHCLPLQTQVAEHFSDHCVHIHSDDMDFLQLSGPQVKLCRHNKARHPHPHEMHLPRDCSTPAAFLRKRALYGKRGSGNALLTSARLANEPWNSKQQLQKLLNGCSPQVATEFHCRMQLYTLQQHPAACAGSSAMPSHVAQAITDKIQWVLSKVMK